MSDFNVLIHKKGMVTFCVCALITTRSDNLCKPHPGVRLSGKKPLPYGRTLGEKREKITKHFEGMIRNKVRFNVASMEAEDKRPCVSYTEVTECRPLRAC